jgi:eukaryotic-like serine/threonine-protein kinase
VTTFPSSTSPGPLPPDTQPGNLPSQPNVGLWSDSDVGLPQGPATAFVTNQASASEKEMPTIGHIGRYALKYRIGAGGLGTVYAAHDPLLSRLVAIKTLSLELSADERESFNTLFLDEARAAGGLSHPHIVTVFDAGVSDNSAYIAMEMLKGRDLRQLRQEGWRPSPAQAALIVRRVADALAYAHSKGVVHRDIKPANIFMVGRTQPRVLDFGIARVAHRHDIGSDDIAAGSPHYMAPEQARHQVVDRRADVFSLGVVLYELLADRKPFRGATLTEITNAVLTHEPPLACEVDRKVPLGLAEIAARAMLKDPEQRYRSARAFSRDLRHWLDDNTAAQEGDVPVPPGPAAGRRWVTWALAGLVVGGVALAVALAPRQKTAAPAPAAVAPAGAAAPVPASATAAAPAAPVALVAPAATAASAAAPSAAAVATATLPAKAEAPATAVATAPAGNATVAAPAAEPKPPAPAPAATKAVPPPTAPPTAPIKTASAAAPVVKKPPAAPAAPALAAASKPAAAPAAKPVPPKPVAVAKAAPTAAKRATEAREAEAKASAAAAAAAPPAAPKTNGTLRIAVSPWGQVEIDGVPAGTTPPLNEITLPEGKHQIIIRNGDFPPFRTTVTVVPGQALSIKHKFGS